MARRDATSVRSWRSIALLVGAAFVLHACYSEWLFSQNQVAAMMPELADSFAEGATSYQAATGELGESWRNLLATLGLSAP